MSTIDIAAFYAFSPVEEANLASLRDELLAFGSAREMRGLTILATEGVNGTVCGTREAVGKWKSLLSARFSSITWNDSAADDHVFPRWLVKVREEIVTLDKPGSRRLEGSHLTPAEWHAMMEDDDAVVIDARNAYETAIGMFDGAIDPRTSHFREFIDFAKRTDIDRGKNILLYCTGGIRCEKAVVAMKDAGFERVFQLHGGILSYLKEFPHRKFSGECFVFDHRVAVDQRLQPSQTYALCPSCGDPGTNKVTCPHCSIDFVACAHCLNATAAVTCSKNCKYHYARHQQSSRAAQDNSVRTEASV